MQDESPTSGMRLPAAALLFSCAALFQAHSSTATPPAPVPGAAAGLTCIPQVTVIDLESGGLDASRSVVIVGDRIQEVAADLGDFADRCAVEVDGRGKYLIPGLWDMHVHGTRREATYPLYLANGVTGVREMLGPPDPGAFRTALEGRHVVAPRIHLGSPVLDGTPPIWPQSIEVETVEEARRAVAEQVQRKASFIKVYERLPRDAYFAILAEALHQAVPVVGHVPSSVTPWEATAAGQKTIEHLTQIPLACSSDEDRLRQVAVRSYGEAISLQVEASRSFSPAKCRLLYAAFRRNGTWMVPTLTVLRSDGWRNDPEFRGDDRLRYFDEDTRAWLEPPLETSPQDDATAATARELLAFHKRLVGEMFDAGVPILAGTDALNPFVFPGFSLHDELALLVDSGLTPLAALQAATSSAAAFLGRSDDYGSVAPGKLADLVLLRASPLDDIRDTTEIAAVFLGGKLFDRAALDELLATDRSAETAGEPGTEAETAASASPRAAASRSAAEPGM